MFLSNLRQNKLAPISTLTVLNFPSFFQIFQVFEHPVEVENLKEVGTLLEFERANFVRFIFNGSWNSVTHRESIDRKGRG